jgi:hypothetical protein
VDALHDADAGDAFSFEGGDRLIDEADGWNREGDPLTLIESALNDVRRGQRLAKTRWGLEHRAPAPGRQ